MTFVTKLEESDGLLKAMIQIFVKIKILGEKNEQLTIHETALDILKLVVILL